jgi:SPP1 gp7 family putative phage head morphogenesis protein
MTFRERLLGAVAAFRGVDQKGQAAKPQQLFNANLIANPRVATTEAFIRNPSLLVQVRSPRIFDEMRRDDMVKASMSLKKQFVVASGYDVESPETEAPDWEVTEFVEDCLEAVEDSFKNIMLQMLTAMDYGFSVTEKVYVKRSDGKLGLKCLQTVNPHEIVFKVSPQGELLCIDQLANNNAAIQNLPLGKFVIFTWDGDFGNPYGRSDLEGAHRAWNMKSQAYNWLATMLERFGIPPVFVHFDQEAIPSDVQHQLYDAVRQWQNGGWGMFPRGESKDAVEFYTPEIAGQVSTVFIPAFKMFNEDIARGLLMPGLLGVTPDAAAGSFARAQTHFDVFMLVVEHARNQLADCVIQEQIIKPLVDLNFAGVTAYPKFKFRALSDDVRADLITLWGTLTGQNVVQTTPTDEEHIRKQMKFPEMETAHKSLDDAGPDNPYKPAPPPQLDPNKPKDEPPEPEKKDNVAKLSEIEGVKRQLTKYETKVSFSKIERDLDEMNAAHLERMKSSLETIKAGVMADIRVNWAPTLEFATSYSKLPMTDGLLANVSAMLKDGMQRGRESLISELPGAKFAEASLPDANLDDALAYLRAKSFWVSGVTDQKILADVRQALLQGVSNGETLDEIMDRLREIFRPYVETSLDDKGVLLEPARLETIVRTNLIDVYNQGRMVQGAQAEEYLEGWQYSAILDTRTTEVCQHMDGKVFLADDKRASALRPPRHFNCRSIMVPVVIGETIDEADKITDSQVNTAKELSGSGF